MACTSASDRPVQCAKSTLQRALITALLALCTATASAADDISDFYRGRTISIVVGYVPGGGYDQAARVIAQHIGRHIPGEPTVVVNNMPGAGTVVSANHVNNVAPRDGSVIGMYADILPLAPLAGVTGVQFDVRKFIWLGSMGSRSTPVLVLRTDAPATTLDGLREKEVLIAASGPDASMSYALLLNDILGFKLKVLNGYRGGTAEIDLAIERGEAHGRASMEWTTLKSRDWLSRKMAFVALQMSVDRNAELQNVPTVMELARTDDDRQIIEMVVWTTRLYRSFSLAGGVPDARVAALRSAFVKTRDDPAFVRDFNRAYEPGIVYTSPDAIEAFIERAYAAPPSVVARAKKYLAP